MTEQEFYERAMGLCNDAKNEGFPHIVVVGCPSTESNKNHVVVSGSDDEICGMFYTILANIYLRKLLVKAWYGLIGNQIRKIERIEKTPKDYATE